MRRYIVLEGADGCGKSLQADMLTARLRASGETVLRVDEPDESFPHGKLLREMLKTGTHVEAHAAMFLANRTTMLVSKVRPALERGETVVSGRSWLSTIVYQVDNWPVDWLLDIHRSLPAKATHMFVLDVPVEVALERRSRRPGQAEYYEKLETQRKVRDRYTAWCEHWARGLRPRLETFMDFGNPVFEKIDASGSPEAVHEIIMGHLGLPT